MEYEGEFKSLELGKKRGKLLLKFITKNINPKTKTIVDFGCGWGALSLEFSKKFKKVIAIDISKESVSVVKDRIKKSKKKNIIAKQGDSLKMPLQNNSIDVLSMIGVIEWVGCSTDKLTPKQAQVKTLDESYRVLKKNSMLVIGTENRFFPFFWIKEPHNHAFLLGLLPFKIANFLSRKRYFHRLLFYSEIKNLFSRFSNTTIYVAIPHYQHTYEVVNINNYKEIVSACNRARRYKLTTKLKFMTYWIQMIAYLRLTKLLTPNFIIVAEK